MRGVVKGSVEYASPTLNSSLSNGQRSKCLHSASVGLAKMYQKLIRRDGFAIVHAATFTTFMGNQYLLHRGYLYNPHFRMAQLTALCLCPHMRCCFAFMLSCFLLKSSFHVPYNSIGVQPRF